MTIRNYPVTILNYKKPDKVQIKYFVEATVDLK